MVMSRNASDDAPSAQIIISAITLFAIVFMPLRFALRYEGHQNKSKIIKLFLQQLMDQKKIKKALNLLNQN